MRLRHQFNVIIEAKDSDGETTAETLLAGCIARALESEGGLWRRTVEVEFVETFDSESDEEIRTTALVQDAMDSLEPKSDPEFARSLKNVMDAWEAMSPAQRHLIGKRILDKIKE